MSEETFYHSYLNRDLLIHVLDPDTGTCEQLSLFFRLEGFQTAFSLDAVSFFAAVERRRPDLAVVNFRIGNDDGLLVLRRIKSLRSGIPVFILTDRPDVDAAVSAMKAGAYDVVTKPIDTDRLLRGAREALHEDVHLNPPQGGRRSIEVRGFTQSPRASARFCSSSPMASPTRKPAASSASPPAPSRSTAPALWKSSAPATPRT